jgi:hypothetical protein
MGGKSKLSRWEWDFSKAERTGVPDDQLVACCYWEYARESNAIRNAVKIVKTALANQGKPAPETPEREAFRVTANCAYGMLHETGLPLSFWMGLPFPEAPWQRIDETKRAKWAQFRPKIPSLETRPFGTKGDVCIAGALQSEAKRVHEARLEIYRRLSEIDRGVANLEEADELRKKLSELAIHPVIVRGEGGVDSFIAQINWREFTNRDIKRGFNKWVVNARPPSFPEPTGRGHKPVDWRAKLQSLGLLRLRSRYTIDATLACLAKLPKERRKQTKLLEPGECNRQAGEAMSHFQALFPFLDPAEMALAPLEKK